MTSRHSHFFELQDALGQPDCALCRLTAESVVAYFKTLGFEQVNDIDLRAELRAGGGFCPRHAWAFHEDSGNRLGVAIVYRDLVSQALRDLEAGGRVVSPAGFGRRLGKLLGGTKAAEPRGTPPEESCTACRYEADAEQRYRGTLLEHLGEEDFRALYAASDGLCLPHLARALESPARPADLAWLRQDAVRRLGELTAELDEYIRKHDYRFRHEGFGGEADSPRRAVERAVGRRTSRQ